MHVYFRVLNIFTFKDVYACERVYAHVHVLYVSECAYSHAFDKGRLYYVFYLF